MLTEELVTEAARDAAWPGPARFVARTGSTNSDLFRLGAEGAPAWTMLAAGYQEAGRGRLGRAWIAPPGTSLLVSVLIRPAVDPASVPLLSLAAAVAMAEACQDRGVDARCKWPNDLVCGERKLGGILPEASIGAAGIEFVVVGAGVNVRQGAEDFPPELRPLATSIRLEGGEADPARLLRAYLAGLGRWIDGAGRPDPGFLERYREICSTIGRRVRARTTGGDAVEGPAVGMADSGELLVETSAGLRAVAFGEVEHLR
jgi:BirA family biotin operon repressor/biotin-[acetyl-CoA-carboxylase] ligase